MDNISPYDELTLRLWRWWRTDESNCYVRLTSHATMQLYNSKKKKWVQLNSYYFKRATQDPEFQEIEVRGQE